MGVKRRQNWLGQQRVDAPHLKSIESAISNDFDELMSALVTGEDKSYIIRGFKINMPGSIGSSASGLQLIVENSAFLHGKSNESGTFFTIPTGTPTEILSSTTNDKVDGAFTPNTDNYIGIEFGRGVDDTTIDQVNFWNPTTDIEITKTVPLALMLDYKIVITTAAFASNVLPIAIVQTDLSNNVVEITDRRDLMWRLATAGDQEPDPFYEYPWTEGRQENFYKSSVSTSSPFEGGDKQIGSMKEFFNAMMTEMKQMKGTAYWYSENVGGSTYRLRQDTTNLTVTGSGSVSHGVVMFNGQVAGMTTDIILTAESGVVTLVADNIKDIATLVTEWNNDSNNATNQITTVSGITTQVPTVDVALTSTPGQINWDNDFYLNFIGGRLRYSITGNPTGSDLTLLDNQNGYVKLIRGVGVIPNLVFTTTSAVVTSVGNVDWTSDLQAGDYIKNAAEGDEKYYEIASVDTLFQVTLTENFAEVGSGTAGFDAQYAFGSYEVNTTPSTDRHIYIADRGSVPFGQDYFWLFSRQDNGGSIPNVYLRPLGGGELEQGEVKEISDNTSQSILDYTGSTGESDSTPDYSDSVQGAKNTQTNYSTIQGENLTIRSSKLTAMMADKAQDKTIQFAPTLDYIDNTTNGAAQELTFVHDSAAPVLDIFVPSSANKGQIDLLGTLSLLVNQAAYFAVDRNGAFNFTLAGLTVSAIEDVPLSEGAFIFASRGTTTSVHRWDGVELIEGRNLTEGAMSEILDSNAYDEQIEVISGAPGSGNEITGPILPGQNINLPLDSKDANSVQGYVVGKGLLEVKLNGQELVQDTDWQEQGSVGDVSLLFKILIDLEVDDILTVRIDTAGGYFGIGAVSGETNTGSNLGAQNEVFKTKILADLQFRTIRGGANTEVITTGDIIDVNNYGYATVNAKIASTPLTLIENVILANANAGDVTLTLPAAATATGKKYNIKKTDASANKVIIDANVAETIDGALTLETTTQFESFTIICDGTAWYII